MVDMMGMGHSRTQKALLVGGVGLLVNGILGSVKLFIGWQSGFLSVMGDGFNNITDMGSVLLLMMTFYYAAKPSDKEHPFGHGRLEYINSTVMSAVILYVGITLMTESVEKIMHPEDTHFTPLVAGVLIFGLIGKMFLAWWYKKASRDLQSESFLAYSADSLSDMLSTAGVLVATLVEYFLGYHIDGIMGALMSLFILWTGYGILKQAINSIMGTKPDAELYKEIKDCILSCPGVYGVHDLIVHDYGPENHFCTAHVELDSELNLVESHELAENVMTTLREKLKVQATIHADPKAVSNPKEEEYRRDVESAIYRSGLPLSYHDFFVEENQDAINLSFELSLTGACKKSDEEIYEVILRELTKINPKYHVETMVDRNFISGKVYGDSNDSFIDAEIRKSAEHK